MTQVIQPPAPPADQKQHYHLICAEIVFKPNDQDMISMVRINGMIVDKEPGLPQRLIGKAQQTVQLNFHRKVEEESANVTIVDVVLLNIVYLGEFTQAEFFKTPEGTKLAKKKEPTLTAVPDLETAVAEAGDQSSNDAPTAA